jgi:quercetin dioxygenase-like cupin family protein
MRSSSVVTTALWLVATVAMLQGAQPTTQPGTAATPAAPAGTKAATQAPAKTPAQHVMAADQLTWGEAPPALPKGAQFAVLQGDPTAKSGGFTIRVKFPDGYKVMPHTHPSAENVTVVSGAIRVGMGREWNDATMQDMTAGGFAHMPANSPHYVQARGETILQVHGTSPFMLTYVNPADDPRKAAPTKPPS